MKKIGFTIIFACFIPCAFSMDGLPSDQQSVHKSAFREISASDKSLLQSALSSSLLLSSELDELEWDKSTLDESAFLQLKLNRSTEKIEVLLQICNIIDSLIKIELDPTKSEKLLQMKSYTEKELVFTKSCMETLTRNVLLPLNSQ